MYDNGDQFDDGGQHIQKRWKQNKMKGGHFYHTLPSNYYSLVVLDGIWIDT